MTFAVKKSQSIRFTNKLEEKSKISINKPQNKHYTPFQYFQKRGIDLIIGGSLFIVTLPVMAYAVLRIKKQSPGSIFFKQSRIGLNGKAFTCYKFRSMHIEKEVYNDDKVKKDTRYTQDNDNRIFPFGNTMRKMRIDELPQLLNIIKGEMHLVGPRAEWDILVKDYEKIIPNYHDRHQVSPGITGLAQVCYPYGRNVEDAKEKLKFDIKYINSWSINEEIKVIFKTIAVVLGKRGM